MCGRAEWMTMRKISKRTPEQIVVKLEKVEALRGEGMYSSGLPRAGHQRGDVVPMASALRVDESL